MPYLRQEGDTTTLSFASNSGVSVQNLQAGNGSTQLSSTAIQAFTGNRVTINVQGDLNAALSPVGSLNFDS